MLSGQAYSVVEGAAIRHQRGRGENAMAVRFHDSFIHVLRETEVVGVYHQLFARGQNSLSWILRNFLGLARMSFISACISRVAAFSVSYSCGLTTNCPSAPCPELMRSTVEFSFDTSEFNWVWS